MTPDILEYIRAALADQPAALAVEPVLRQARQIYGGETVYIRSRDPARPTRRTVQRRLRLAGPEGGR